MLVICFKHLHHHVLMDLRLSLIDYHWYLIGVALHDISRVS